MPHPASRRLLPPFRPSHPHLLTLLLSLAMGAPAGAGNPSDAWRFPTPAEIQVGLRLDPGLAIELVAAEPQIESPVAMAFDERGRLWVVEMVATIRTARPRANPLKVGSRSSKTATTTAGSRPVSSLPRDSPLPTG